MANVCKLTLVLAAFLFTSSVNAAYDHGIYVNSTVAQATCEADKTISTPCTYAQGGNHMCSDGGTKNFWYHTSPPDPGDPNDHYFGFCSNGQCPPIYVPDANGMCQVEDPSWSGYKSITLSYDTQKRLESVAGPFGHNLDFAYDGANRVTSITDPGGNTYTYQYDGNDNLVSVTQPGGTTRQYLYEDTYERNALTGIIDENGNRYATWSYDVPGTPVGRVISSEHAGGADHVQLTYNGDGTTTVTDALGGTRTYSFTTQYGATKTNQITGDQCATCGNHGQKVITYDSNGFIASVTDWADNVTNYVNNSRGLQISRTEAVGTPLQRTISTTWHANFRLPVSISEPGRTTTFTYDSAGRVLTQTEVDTATSASRTTTYTYNAAGLLATVDGPRTDVADVTIYTYDSAGNRVTLTNALGQVTNYSSYDNSGHLLAMSDPNGVVTTMTYDIKGRLITRTTGGVTTTFAYDGVGNLTRITSPDSSFLDYSYDAAHRLISVADSAGNHIDYTLDAVGNRTAVNIFDSQGTLRNTRTYVYNNLSRLVQMLGAQSQSTSFAYDGNGNRISVTDPLSRVTTQAYDALNRLITSTDADLVNTSYTYDARDNLLSVTDPRGKLTSYNYDGLNNLTQQVSPDTGTTTYTYDSAGNRLSQTNARGITVTYNYDAHNRLISETYPDSALNINYTYDQGTNGVGQLTGMSDASGTTTFSYDAHGNRIGESRTILGVNYVTQFAYDAADHLTQITYPSGRIVNYTRDTTGRITNVSTMVGTATTPIASTIGYLPFGGIQTMTLGNGITVTQDHDQDYQLTSRTDGAVQSLTYTYDAAGNITSITNGLDSTRSQGFNYDILDRLIHAAGIYGILNYTYDAIGNRLSEWNTTSTDTYTYASANNRLLSIVGPNANSFNYDAVGNTTQAGNITLAYNDINRLDQITANNQTTHYVYNANGERVTKIGASGSVTVYHYDQQGHLLAETDDSGTTLLEYIYLDGSRLAVIDGSGVYYIHTNHLDTPQVVTDSTAQVVWKADYKPFGDANVIVNTLDQKQRFPGQYYDQETGLHYNYFRYYDPETGRYITADPVGLSGGLNSYTYALNNPLFWSDPLGLACTSANGRMTCSFPGGPSFTLPSPSGYPDQLGPDDLFYHDTNVSRDLDGADPECVMRELAKRPTPGPHPNPASRGGTPNNAPILGDNFVRSFRTTANGSGIPLIVNTAGVADGSDFGPGYIMRYVHDGRAYTVGEGTNWKQGADWLTDLVNEPVWGWDLDRIIKKCKCEQ